MLVRMGLALCPVLAGDNLKAPRTEVRQHDLAAWFHHPQHLLQHLLEMRDVVHGVHGNGSVKRSSPPRQARGIPNNEPDLPLHARVTCIEARASLLLGSNVHRRYRSGVPRQPNQEPPLPRPDLQHLPAQRQRLRQHKTNRRRRIVPKPAQPRLALQDLPSVRERFGIVRGSFHGALGYRLSILCHMPA